MPASQHIAGDIELIGSLLPVSTQEDAGTAVIAGGDLCNMQEATDLWQTCPTSGIAPFAVATVYGKAVNASPSKVELWRGPGVYVYVKADSAIPANNQVASGAVTAGRVGAFVDGTTAGNRLVGRYKAKGNVTPIQGDGLTATTAAANGDLILIELYGNV